MLILSVMLKYCHFNFNIFFKADEYSFILFSGVQSNNHINKVVSHPTLPVTITAHEDRHIKFFDNKTGKDKENLICIYEYVLKNLDDVGRIHL